MTLLDRVVVYRQSFPLVGIGCLYAKRGVGTNVATNHTIPQRLHCCISRLLNGRYVLNRIDQSDNPEIWPIQSPECVVVVPLRGERLCFHMRDLLFFSAELRLSTIVNLQLPWASFEYPFVSYAEGVGHIGFRVDGEPELIARLDDTSPPERLQLPRLVAWSSDTRLTIAAMGGWFNAVTFAEPVAEVRHAQLVIGRRMTAETRSDLSVLARMRTFIGV